MSIDVKLLKAFYKKRIEKNILPFWHRAVDREYGGIYSCFNNSGDTLISKDKYTWSQGRFLWLWAKIVRMIEHHKLAGNTNPYLEQLHKTVEFLERNVFLKNGNCAFLLSESGQKKESIENQGFDTSVYADCFIVLGISAYARTVGDSKRFEESLSLYNRIRGRIKAGNILTEPYPVPKGYKAHGIPMSMLNMAQELTEAAEILDHPKGDLLYEQSIGYMEDVMEVFLQQNNRIVEMLPDDESKKDTLLYCHVNPGHTIECMWFVLKTAQKTGNDRYIRQAIDVIERAIKVGWDAEYGGLLRFVDTNGGKPRGRTIGTPYEQLVNESWDMKLWWPHSEALYATLRTYSISGEKKMEQLYEKVADYVFDTFPNPDQEIGEWIQILNRKGEPIDEIAALPVKDPFHILRNMLLIIDLLEGEERTKRSKQGG